MPDTSTPAPSKGRHYDFISSTLSENFKTASLGRGKALASAALKIEPWYNTAPAAQHAQLKTANLKAWGSQNQVDTLFEKLQDVRTFAAPLLQAKLLEKYAVTDDVKTTFLRLYIPKEGAWYTIDTLGGVTTRTVSLLDAALHNFAKTETVLADSQYISQPDNRGHFDILPIKAKMTISQFQALCRELDIGGLYKQHLQSYLLPSEPVAVAVIKHKVTQSLKDALSAAAQLALTTGDIQFDAYKLMTALANGAPLPPLDGQHMQCRDLSIMEARLTGVLLLIPARKDSRGIRRLIAYVPHDPEHPLKEYTSPAAFMTELTRQLRENKTGAASQLSYRQFFSQFVDQQQRGHFFADIEQRLSHVVWHEKDDPTDSRPTWRQEDVPNAHLKFEHLPLPLDYWTHAYQQKLDKILNDAKEVAVSTADTDTKARWAWWENFKKIVSDIFNVALLIATPFVPGLGELMMAYTVYQLTYDVIEGIIDLAEGLGLEAAEHVVSVVTDVIQLVAFAAGAEIAGAFKFKLSPLIEGMKPVKLPNGRDTLWHPDHVPYEHKTIKLPQGAKPDATGVHSYEGKEILRAQDKHYELTRDAQTGTTRLKHPERTEAYQPQVVLNGAGAYVLEGEQPRTWDDATLLRRIGPAVADLSDAQLETARKISGTDPAELRGMYVENLRPPTLLTDTIERLDVDLDIQTFIDLMSSDDPRVYAKADPVTQLQILTAHGMWPEKASMRIIDVTHQTIWEHTGTDASAGQKLIVQLQEQQFFNGELLKVVMETLDENGTAIILDVPANILPASLVTRVTALRKRIVAVTESGRTQLFNEDYASREVFKDKSLAPLIRAAFPEIPAQGIDNLLATATSAERAIMIAESRLPLRLKRIARELQLETRTARAHEGFYRQSLTNLDTERMTLNALRLYSNSLEGVRIELRVARFDAELTCQAGPEDAATVRILVKVSSRYEVHDAQGTKLHGPTDLYQGVLQALPDAQLKTLGLRRGDGYLFKQWVIAQTATPAERRIILDDRGRVPEWRREELLLLRGPKQSMHDANLTSRVEDLYPHFNEREVRQFVQSLSTQEGAIATLMRLETELDDLRVLLRRWQWDQPDYPISDPRNFVGGGGQHIADQLIECFKRKARFFDKHSAHLDEGYTLDLSTDLFPSNLVTWWKKLPELGKYLEQITSLNVDNSRFAIHSKGLLKDFRQLRHLSARKCHLTQLPEGIGNMHMLETLRLSDNRIALTAADVESLRNLTRLESLRLDGNPLGRAVNVERMPHLKVLSLNKTGIDGWPEGVFKKRRPKSFFLDMQENPINRIPEVPAGSGQALLIARTRLSAEDLSETNLLAYREYRISVGIDPQHYYSELADRDVELWRMPGRTRWGTSESARTPFRLEAWHDLATEPDSLGFFQVIEKLLSSADYRNGGDARKQLTDRVWRMIDAAYLDPKVRNELFTESTAPTTCANAGAQMFNHMGIKVLASEAYSYSTSQAELEGKLVILARGAARLEQVNEVARADMAARQGRPDEVEVHLAYETGLAERLELPWQSQDRLWSQIAGVDQATIDQAYDTVIALEEGDGLVNNMLEQIFWLEYLRDTYPGQFKNNAKIYEGKAEQLDELRAAQQAWADGKDLPEAQKASLKVALQNLARQLSVPDSTVFTGQAMSDAVYERLYTDIGDEEQALGRRLTRTAMKNAGI
ncbi:NEL-type E3 ubiquitin ligase domain-containing protein [Pseudomonas sp. NPDC098747]|uniref:NEL-type E3 ubiquitin ligase domain-containing protein n=1 Tax=Pseudomonas sp. NPDC098747 TaxID=3364487 RepID=UPI00383BDA11